MYREKEKNMIALGCDHGGYELMQEVKAHLTKRGFEYKDFGCYGTEAVDYPEFGRAAAEAVASGECECGIVICGTGTLFAVMEIPIPVPQITIPYSHSPDATASAAARPNSG